ncbi:hypothetical protein ASPCAL03219 [Aspergillus calidoustus]|uniref:Uncharacterized protein n=1 Tax=Aspergillus calidoustus TaxID=454130 RepID=A0A0U5CP18_ASPCI|nr:hypothetical protein ASPCAL03219 [Aspergillus calidoustus]
MEIPRAVDSSTSSYKRSWVLASCAHPGSLSDSPSIMLIFPLIILLYTAIARGQAIIHTVSTPADPSTPPTSTCTPIFVNPDGTEVHQTAGMILLCREPTTQPSTFIEPAIPTETSRANFRLARNEGIGLLGLGVVLAACLFPVID